MHGGVREQIGLPNIMLSLFGESLNKFLNLQLKQGHSSNVYRYLLAKTPSVKNIGNIYDFFPKAKLLIIVRDGRALVESGVRSFNWKYAHAMKKWAENAFEILDFKKKHECFIVNFEKLYTNEEQVLRNIFSYLEIDPNKYDYNEIKNLGVTGSSDTASGGKSIHFNIVKKSDNFKPLQRHENWNTFKLKRFQWIAGEQMQQLGYSLSPSFNESKFYKLQNQFSDFVTFRILTSLSRRKQMVFKTLGKVKRSVLDYKCFLL